MRVLILGGSGFVGSHLAARLALRGDTSIVSSLRDPVAAAERASGCDAIVNLAGEPIGRRWSRAVKERIETSRIELPRRFLDALDRRERSARIYVTASGVDYYGSDANATFVEESPPGETFLARVCRGWEEQALRARALGMRAAAIRTGPALAPEGGVLARLLPLFRLGLGGPLGDGSQWLSWIHIVDLTGIYLAALDRGDGAYNAVAPNPVSNREFARDLGAALHRPAVLPVPAFAVRAVLGEAAGVVLGGQRVLPKRTTEQLAYTFEFPLLREALAQLLERR